MCSTGFSYLNSLGHRTLLASCNNCGQICTNLGHEREQTGVNAGSYWPATNSAERENFRNGLLFSSSARCILLTNYCGASFSSWHTSTETWKVTSDEKVPLSEFCIAVPFGTGPLGHNILAVKIFLVSAFSQICASSSGTGLFFPGELPADDSINLCPATVAHNSNQSLGSDFQKPEHQTRQQVSIIVSNQGQVGPWKTPFRSENRWHSQRPQEDRVALRKWCQAGLAKKSTLAALDARRRCLFPEKRLGLHTKIQRSRLTRSNLKRDLSSSLSWIKRQVAYQELVPLIKWRRRWRHRGMKYKHKKKHFSCCLFLSLKSYDTSTNVQSSATCFHRLHFLQYARRSSQLIISFFQRPWQLFTCSILPLFLCWVGVLRQTHNQTKPILTPIPTLTPTLVPTPTWQMFCCNKSWQSVSDVENGAEGSSAELMANPRLIRAGYDQ